MRLKLLLPDVEPTKFEKPKEFAMLKTEYPPKYTIPALLDLGYRGIVDVYKVSILVKDRNWHRFLSKRCQKHHF